MKLLYTAHGHASGGGRNGLAGTDNGRLTFTLSSPTELGGEGNGTNPEEIFACGYAACFLGAMRFAANRDKLTMPEATSVKAAVSIGPRDDGAGFSIQVALEVSMPGLNTAEAEDIIKRGHVVCPYSHAIQNNVIVTTTLI